MTITNTVTFLLNNDSNLSFSWFSFKSNYFGSLAYYIYYHLLTTDIMRQIVSRWTLVLFIVLSAVLGTIESQIITFGMRKLAYSTNQFGLDLMRSMDQFNSSSVFCPICISSSLVMLLIGSHGTTTSSLRHSLYLWGMQPNEIDLAFLDMMNHLGVNMQNNNERGIIRIMGQGDYRMSLSNPEVNSGNDIVFLNQIYVQRDFGINYNYHMLLQRYYKTAVHPLDFIDNAEETRSHINAIVERQTMGKIKDILPEHQTHPTQLLLLSALYFSGTLDLNITLSSRRNQLNREPVNVFEDPFVLEASNVRIRYGFNSYLNCTAIEMPFKGGLITLVAIAPNEPAGLNMLLARLSAQVLSDVINALEVRRVNVKVSDNI